MSGHDQSSSPSTWADAFNTLAEGGIPQVIAGPAGKAVSRLIAGAADIPAAWLEKQAQAIRDQKDARSVIVKSIADAASKTAASDQQVLERAMGRLVNDLYRKQENREAVGRLAAEHLRIDPPPLESEGPTDDWMNSFQRYAEDASSDDFRAIWAKILAGEVRQRGAYSARTLQLVSSLDADMAKLIEKALKYAIGDAIGIELLQSNLSFQESFALQDFGFMAMHGQFGSTFSLKIKDDGYGVIFTDQFVFQVKVPSKQTMFPCYILTRVGRELAKALDIKIDAVAIARSLWSANPKPTEVQFATVLSRRGDQAQVGPWQVSQAQ